jgi:hypothetical protein
VARRSYRFTPYKPPSPPSGSYDPALDSQQQAAQRGVLDLRQDLETQGTRALSDYGIGREQLGSSYQQGVQDLQTQQGRASDDYRHNLQLLTRNYSNLYESQKEQANQAGVISGGALLQSAAKRQGNYDVQKGELDTGVQRQMQDIGTRAGQLNQDFAAQSGQLGLGLARQGEDRTTQLQRALRENQAFNLDLTGQRAYQAAGSGWSPPGRGQAGGMPGNEFVNAATGAHHRVVISGNERLIVDPSGRVISRRPR